MMKYPKQEGWRIFTMLERQPYYKYQNKYTSDFKGAQGNSKCGGR